VEPSASRAYTEAASDLVVAVSSISSGAMAVLLSRRLPAMYHLVHA
jgi:hypothetical protein